MEALYYSVPLITFPQMLEQVTNADQVEELGLGERLDAGTVTAEALRAAVTRVASNPGVHANLHRMRNVVRESGGATGGADLIEEYAPLEARISRWLAWC